MTACGGDAAPTPQAGSAMLTGTLAYVVSECRDKKATGYFLHQSLVVRQGERAPIIVKEIPDIGPVRAFGLCGLVSRFRAGFNSSGFGAFQRLAVTLDGSAVVFELSDEFSLLGQFFSLPPEEKGFFFVRADGTGLRRLGPPSRQVAFIINVNFDNDLAISPDNRRITFPDLGPGPDGTEATQIATLDVATGTRTQITHLPPAPATADLQLPGGLCCPFFLDSQTIAFSTVANPDGLNPTATVISPIVNADGARGLRLIPPPVALPGSQVDFRFVITGGKPTSTVLTVGGDPVNPSSGQQVIAEAFFFDGAQDLVQLTNFHRADTRTFGGDARQRVFIVASADPLGTNPPNNCQIFSSAPLGGDLRQLTQFHETEHARIGCANSSPLGSGCSIGPVAKDTNTSALVFDSQCDPFGTNPNGNQLFAMSPDGTDLRQLTETRGLVREPDGTVIGELPGPSAYSGQNGG